MSFPTIQPSFDRLQANNNSASFIDRNVYARLESLKIAGQEVWQFIVNIGESIKNFIGATVKLPFRAVNWLFPSCTFIKRVHDWLPSYDAFQDSATKVVQAALGVFSSVLLGVVVNPSWNYNFQRKVGIIPAPVNP